MPEKVVISPPSNQWPLWFIPILQWRVGLLTALAFVGMVLVWSIDGCTVKNVIQAWRYRQDYLAVRWSAHGGEPCKDSKTVEIAIPGLDGEKVIELSAGEVHEFGFQALDESGKPHCSGGDYFETDLSGESWKSRPLVKDFNNGSYSISLQVHPDFDGVYNLTIILLYRHYEGLKFTPWRFSYDRVLRNFAIRFYKSSVQIPELHTCQASDFGMDVWCGRWTRHGKNDDCLIGNDGRYRCLAPDFPCKAPWCDGSLGILESNGWVYSTHCSFKMYSAESAWNCLKNRWIFFWGDSNHVDTIRNILNFILDLPEIHAVPRRFDMNFSNPKDPSQTVRITSIFNGHWNETQNYLGLDSLRDEGFQNLLKKYFSEDTVPDTMIMNSGLHDGVHWRNIRAFSVGADYAASFWADVMKTVKQRGLAWPRVFYRTTVATGGYARSLAFNPNKMEVFNGVLLEKLKQAGVVSGVIDNFDMTFPWHFDNRCNDGVHYGRAPAKMKWRDGQIGHQYFVDIMLAHVLLNALSAR
ncbi:Immunoglobulin-like fold [Sesbania bispinosa]|nr:Immunoglobulin-like fold [Sesbania bispinosa]